MLFTCAMEKSIKIGKNDIRKASYSRTPALPEPISGSSQQYWKNFVIKGLKEGLVAWSSGSEKPR